MLASGPTIVVEGVRTHTGVAESRSMCAGSCVGPRCGYGLVLVASLSRTKECFNPCFGVSHVARKTLVTRCRALGTSKP